MMQPKALSNTFLYLGIAAEQAQHSTKNDDCIICSCRALPSDRLYI